MARAFFDSHAESLTQYQAELNRAQPDASTGQIVYAGITIPAVVGTFAVRQVLMNGGFITMMQAVVQVNKGDLPANTNFQTGQPLDVVQPGSPSRRCKLEFLEDGYSFFKLTVMASTQKI